MVSSEGVPHTESAVLPFAFANVMTLPPVSHTNMLMTEGIQRLVKQLSWLWLSPRNLQMKRRSRPCRQIWQ